MTGPQGWTEFWNRPNRIYANDRHRAFHHRRIADDLIAVIPHAGATVLDFGCGEALDAERIARHCARLILTDSAPSVRDRLQRRFGSVPGIDVVAPGELALAVDAAGVDLAVMNSVAQYLAPRELETVLRDLHALLRPDGMLVLGDVVPPGVPITADVASLLRTAWSGGFLPAALVSLVATFFSDYRRLRREVGLACYDEAQMLALLARSGYAGERRAHNVGFHRRRLTFIARPSPAAAPV